MDQAELSERLADFLKRSHNARSVRIENLRLLTGGASRQTWAFDATVEDDDNSIDTYPLVLRRDPRASVGLMARETEYRVLEAAYAAGVPVPNMHAVGDDSLDAPFFVMERIEGETIARKLLRDGEYANARRNMTSQLGAILAKVHTIALDSPGLDLLPSLPLDANPAETEVSRFEQVYRAITPDPHPAFELAFRWLKEHLPPAARRTLVHGDYRIGNIIFGPDGVHAVIDWELAHAGDPMEDLGWICVRSWRFGSDDKPVGGIGTREEFWRAYEAAGGFPVDAEHVRFWELFGNLRWGIICISQAKTYLDGNSTSVELAAIGRRVAETEWELLQLMEA
ncbi:MAG: phosphotransferase family protein [Dehalococcoidia bacterium]